MAIGIITINNDNDPDFLARCGYVKLNCQCALGLKELIEL